MLLFAHPVLRRVDLPRERDAREACEAIIHDVVKSEGQRVIGWRDVPVDALAVYEVVYGRIASVWLYTP